MENSTLVLTLKKLQTMTALDYEEMRSNSNQERNKLENIVISLLDVPDKWSINNEYSERCIKLFPVQIFMTPPSNDFCLFLCSPGHISLQWQLALIDKNGDLYIVQTQRTFFPEAINHMLALTAILDDKGYSVNDILHVLLTEGGK